MRQQSEFEKWMITKGYRPNTAYGAHRAADRYLKWCRDGHLNAQDATPRQVLDYVAHIRSRNLAPNTIRTNIEAVRTWYVFVGRKNNPCFVIKIRGIIRKLPPPPLSLSELGQLHLSYPDNRPRHRRDRVMVSLLVYQGLELADLTAMTIEDALLNEGKINVPASHRTNGRKLELKPWQLAEMHTYLLKDRQVLLKVRGTDTDRLFFSLAKDGNRLNMQISKALKILKRINPRVKDTKHLRSSVIHNWLDEAGKDWMRVQYLAGYKYPSSLERHRVQ